MARSWAAVVSIPVPSAESLADCAASRRSSSIAADPAMVCTTRSVATGLVRPAATPASTKASTTRKKYAGPEPDTAVTASICDSGDRQHTADRVEDRRRLLELFGGREPAGRQRADAAADDHRRIGHHPDDRCSGRQLRLVELGGDTRGHGHENLLDAVAFGVRGGLGDLIDDECHVGGLDGDDDERGVLRRARPPWSPAPSTSRTGTSRALGSFSATTRSLTCRPARSSPASRASPILPPPMIAILATVKALQTPPAVTAGAAPSPVGGSARRCGLRSRRRCGPRRTSPGRSASSCTRPAASRRRAAPRR